MSRSENIDEPVSNPTVLEKLEKSQDLNRKLMRFNRDILDRHKNLGNQFQRAVGREITLRKAVLDFIKEVGYAADTSPLLRTDSGLQLVEVVLATSEEEVNLINDILTSLSGVMQALQMAREFVPAIQDAPEGTFTQEDVDNFLQLGQGAFSMLAK